MIDYSKNGESRQTGGVMLLVLMMLILFIAIMSATLQYVIRQSHETVDQEQEEQAFNVADSGVSYVQWMLDPTGGQKLPADIVVMTQMVHDDLGQEIGTFTIDDLWADTNEIIFTSTGRDVELTDRCQVIRVGMKQLEADEQYVLTEWDHLVGYPCS